MLNRFIGKNDEPSIDETHAILESRVTQLDQKIVDLDRQIRQNIEMSHKTTGAESQRYKQKALMLLKQKKQHEQHRDITERNQMNLENIQFQVDQMKDYKKVYDTVAASNRQMQILSRQFDINSIEDVQDSMMNFAEDQQEFGDILSQDITNIDLNDLDDELAELGDSMFEGDIQISEPDGFGSVPITNEQFRQEEVSQSDDKKFAI
ncbi:charged multivesicular body protein, putative [Entamoeba dispar SAW760]|uniref:Charged multivesicular body protein, putative n=1 Tax=Entamoeba dispar (strain ATCC PRA-260 / SAW760) TaxID=370354 RepID=B0EE16_ENTDS|nr:charged multivesicular body protein, putative [Entamoeba dispar SAW760]EDR27227.1 charged multivesicular body protein, putative [Entamoeba dispar SAW760]|eukprot:EDR27227.1 charged multivesicular body protein, putative [Entamoeba dispar SAW760]